MSAKIEKLNNILKKLENDSEIFGSAIVNDKGQVMASALHQDIPEINVGAMAAALLAASRRVDEVLKGGGINSITLSSFDKIIMINTEKNFSLITLAPSTAKVGLLDFEITNCINNIKLVLG